MKIISYETKYRPELAKMVNDFNNFIVSLDKSGLYKPFDNQDDIDKYTDKCVTDAEKMNGFIYLATENDQIVGFIQGVIINTQSDLMYSLTHSSKIQGWIGELYVVEGSRGTGIGKQLMQKAIDHFKSNNCDLLCLEAYWHNKTAIGIYESLGMNIGDIKMEMKL
ncbi:MAG: GNAT family N-acetyltransferase [bacterium]